MIELLLLCVLSQPAQGPVTSPPQAPPVVVKQLAAWTQWQNGWWRHTSGSWWHAEYGHWPADTKWGQQQPSQPPSWPRYSVPTVGRAVNC